MCDGDIRTNKKYFLCIACIVPASLKNLWDTLDFGCRLRSVCRDKATVRSVKTVLFVKSVVIFVNKISGGVL